jgi:hypothetical protein
MGRSRDSVHQGDQDGLKGIYHINAVAQQRLSVHQNNNWHFGGILVDYSLVHQIDNCRFGGINYLHH